MVKIRAAAALVVCVVVASAGRAGASMRRPRPRYEEVLARAGARLAAEASKPQAIAALAELAALDEAVPPAALEAAVRRGLVAGAHPLVAAQAAFLLAHLCDERGATEEAASLRAGLGFFTHPSVIGPFGEGRASFRTAFPPESEPAPELARSSRSSHYPGKTHDVGWRAADAAVREGALYLDGLLRPDDQAVAYVAAFVHSDRERAAALRIGSPGPVKIWVNGALVFANDVVRPAVLDQDAAPVRLGRGWNRILIKTVVVDGAWRLYARLTEPSGAPLHLGGQAESPTAEHQMGDGDRRAGPARKVPVVLLDGLLERRAKASTQRGRRPRRGSIWRARWPGSPRGIATRTPPRTPRSARWQRGRRWAATWWRPRSPTTTTSAGAISKRAGELTISPPWRALLLARLGELARTERRETRATESFRSALALDAGCWPAVLALADQESEATLPLAALARVEALPAAVQALPRVRRAAARLYEAAGRRSASDRLLTALSDERRSEVDLLHQLAARARARGDAGGGARPSGHGGSAAARSAVAGHRAGAVRRGGGGGGAGAGGAHRAGGTAAR